MPSFEIMNMNRKRIYCIHTVYQVATRKKKKKKAERELIAFIKFYVERLQEINPEYRLAAAPMMPCK